MHTGELNLLKVYSSIYKCKKKSIVFCPGKISFHISVPYLLQDLHEECQNTQPKLDKLFALNENLQQLQNTSPEAQATFTEDQDQIQARLVTIDGSLIEGTKMIEATLVERKDFVDRCDGIEEQLKQCKNQVEEWKHVFVDEVPTELDRNNVSRLKSI